MSLDLFRYEVESTPFAEGGMGEVYRALDKLSNGLVAIKTINTRKLGLNQMSDADQEKTIRTFIKEAVASFRLGELSPYIVKVIDFGREDNTPYMALEFMEGGNIVTKLGQVNGQTARRIVSDTLHGLKTAHDNMIVHSDVSPHNVLYDPATDKYKLADFGLLKILESHLVTVGLSLHTGGKPHYLPPEHFFDPTKIDFTSDFFGLGVIYYQLLTGELPGHRYPGPPTVPNPIIVKKTQVQLDSVGRDFINACLRQEFDNVDQLRTGLENIKA